MVTWDETGSQGTEADVRELPQLQLMACGLWHNPRFATHNCILGDIADLCGCCHLLLCAS